MADGGPRTGEPRQPDQDPAPESQPRAKHRPPKLPVNVADLRRRLGQRQVEPIHVILAPHQVISSRTTDEPVVGEVTVESIERGVSVTGSVTFVWEGDCRRCLEPTGGPLTIDIDEILQVDAPPDSDIIDFDGDQFDLIPIVADAVVLSLPLAPLCGDDCAGPDPERYPTLAHDADTAERDDEGNLIDGDPRWDALRDLDLDD